MNRVHPGQGPRANFVIRLKALGIQVKTLLTADVFDEGSQAQRAAVKHIDRQGENGKEGQLLHFT